MKSKESNSEWKTVLRELFAKIDDENEQFAANVERKMKFYTEVARPALERIVKELAIYGRECQTGMDDDRFYIIVRRADDETEFQYAVAAKAFIQNVTVEAHAWYEENASREASPDEESGQEAEDEDRNEADDAKNSDGDSGADDADEGDQSDHQEASAAEPRRTKIIEPLTDETSGRTLADLTERVIIEDFISRYRWAIKQERAALNAPDSEMFDRAAKK